MREVFVTGAYSYTGLEIYAIDANQNVYRRNTNGTQPFSLTYNEPLQSYNAWAYSTELLPACATVPVMQRPEAPVLYCSMNDELGTVQLMVVHLNGSRRRLPYRRLKSVTVGLFYDWKEHEMIWSFSFRNGRNAYTVRLGPTMEVMSLVSDPMRFASNISAASAAIYPATDARRKLYILSQVSEYDISGRAGAYNVVELPTARYSDTPAVLVPIPPIPTTW